jgi:very-short-patch-repair endonuclease
VPGSALFGLSAAVVHGLPVGALADRVRPSVIVEHDVTLRCGGIDIRRTRHPFPTRPWYTSQITTVPSTLIALAGLVPRPTLARCLDHAIANQLVSVARLAEEAGARPPARFLGRSVLLEEIKARSGQVVAHRSRLEQRVAQWLRDAALPPAKPNFTVATPGSPRGVEVDFARPGERVALEVSPFFTHGSSHTQVRDMERRRLLQEAGWRLVESTDVHLVDAHSFVPIVAGVRSLLGLGASP